MTRPGLIAANNLSDIADSKAAWDNLGQNITYGPVRWNPSVVATSLWLDAADSSTLTTVSGLVVQWVDKSGNERHAGSAPLANRPAYDTINREVDFDGSNDWLSLASSYGAASQDGLTFYTVASSAAASFMIIGTADETNLGFKGSTSQLRPADGSSLTAGGLPSSNITDSNRHIFGIVQNGFSVKSYTDGAVVSDLTASRTSFRYDRAQYLGRGDGGAGTTVYAVSIAEIIILSSAASDEDRERIEGYLAHKWNLTSTLPSGHPYKQIFPGTTQTFAINGDDIFALQGVGNLTTQEFVFLKGLTSPAQPRIDAEASLADEADSLRDNAMPKTSPTSAGNYTVASGSTVSGVTLQINGTNSLSINTSPFSGSTATTLIALNKLSPQANWRITEPMTSGTIANPTYAIPIETNDLLLFMKVGQS